MFDTKIITHFSFAGIFWFLSQNIKSNLSDGGEIKQNPLGKQQMAYWLTQLPKNILIFASAKDRNRTFTAGSFLHEVRISNFRRRHHSIPPKNDCI